MGMIFCVFIILIATPLIIWVLFFHNVFYFYNDGFRVFSFLGYEKKNRKLFFKDITKWAEFAYNSRYGTDYTLRLYVGDKVFRALSKQMGDADYTKLKTFLPPSIPHDRNLEISHENRQARLVMWFLGFFTLTSVFIAVMIGTKKAYGALILVIFFVIVRSALEMYKISQNKDELKKMADTK